MSFIKIENKLLNQKVHQEMHTIIHSFISSLSRQGKKHVAKKIMSQVFYFIKYRKNVSGLPFIYQAICNVRPLIGIKNKGSNSKRNSKPQVKPLSLHKSYQLAIRWLIQGAKQRSERTMSLRLFYEIIDAHEKKGHAIKKKYEWHLRPLSTLLKTSFKKK